jgi:hypothetical protein
MFRMSKRLSHACAAGSYVNEPLFSANRHSAAVVASRPAAKSGRLGYAIGAQFSQRKVPIF